MKKSNAVQFSIPSRSPDCNPIEICFNLIERNFLTDVLERNIIYELYDQFAERVKD